MVRIPKWTLRASGTATPNIMKDDTVAMAAALPKWITDSISEEVFDRKAMLSENMASIKAPITQASPAASALPGSRPVSCSS